MRPVSICIYFTLFVFGVVSSASTASIHVSNAMTDGLTEYGYTFFDGTQDRPLTETNHPYLNPVEHQINNRGQNTELEADKLHAFDHGFAGRPLEYRYAKNTNKDLSGTGDALLDSIHYVTLKTGGKTDSSITVFGDTEMSVPEPATLLLLGSGLIVLAGLGRKTLAK